MTNDLGRLWVFAEERDNQVVDVCFELLSKGRELANKTGYKLEALILGNKIDGNQIKELYAYGAEKVYLVDNLLLDTYRNPVYIEVFESLVEEYNPDILLMGATRVGLDLAPSLAARLKTGLSAHCIDLDIDDEGHLVQMVPAFGQQMMATILCPQSKPQMATVRPGSFEKVCQEAEFQEVVEVEYDFSKIDTRINVLEQGEIPISDDEILEEAKAVVAGGAGLGGKEGWNLLEQLANVLGASIGATRPAVDEGWANMSQMIGHSGVHISPDLYIGIGISGDMLHMVGIKDARITVGINNDPKAPIFDQVDYGIVSDYSEVLPVLIKELASNFNVQKN